MRQKINNRPIALLIAALVLLSGIMVWHYVTPNKKTEQAALQVAETAALVRRHYASKIDYWGLNTQSAVDNNILTNLPYHKGRLTNALGKPVLIGSGENGETVMPGERSFDVVYGDLSMGECVALAAYRFERPEELGLLQITVVSGDNRQTFSWGEENYKLPVARQEAQKICRKGSKVLWTIE